MSTMPLNLEKRPKPSVLGGLWPPRDLRFEKRPIQSELPGATKQDSFQTRLELILQHKGIGIFQDADRVRALFESSDIDRRTQNVFRTILETEAVDCFIAYTKGQMNEEALVRRCNATLQDEWGLSPDAFRPVMKQMLNAIDRAVQERANSVGKTVCNQLKEMRRKFAEANQIEYEEEDCTEIRPCEGTCPYCEERTRYLVNEAKKIAVIRDVVYPQVEVTEAQDAAGIYGSSEASGEGQIVRDIPPCGGI